MISEDLEVQFLCENMGLGMRPVTWHATSHHAINKVATAMDYPQHVAIRKRIEFLKEQLWTWYKWFDDGCPDVQLPYATIETINKELYRLRKSFNAKPIASKFDITDDHIEQANQVPIDSLVQFKFGKAKCPFHDDSRPSMYHGTRKNIAMCPVCNKGWTPIKLVMQRDGLQFKDAVRYLCSL